MPWFAYVDWVEYQTWNEDKDKFSVEWDDAFDSFDTERWESSNEGGWDGTRGTFSSQNVFTANGMLVLAIDSEDDKLFEDVQYSEEDQASNIVGMSALGSLLLTTMLTA